MYVYIYSSRFRSRILIHTPLTHYTTTHRSDDLDNTKVRL